MKFSVNDSFSEEEANSHHVASEEVMAMFVGDGCDAKEGLCTMTNVNFTRTRVQGKYRHAFFFLIGAMLPACLLVLSVTTDIQKDHKWEYKHEIFHATVTYWDPSTRIIDKDIDRNVIVPELDAHVSTDRDAMYVRPDKNSAAIIHVVFSTFPSYDAHFDILRVDGDGKEENLGRAEGYNLSLPGDGYVYTTGHINSAFDIHRKYRIDGSKIEEVKQPFYYVGLKAKCRHPLTLWTNLDGGQVVTKLDAGASIDVLLSSDIEQYLVRDSFGLTGWTEVKELDPKSPAIEGLFIVGD